MRITGFEITRVRIPLARPYVLSRGGVQAFTNLILRLDGEDGLYGLGECAVLSLMGDLDANERYLRDRVSWIVGMDSTDIESVLRRVDPSSAPELAPVAAIDLAVSDLRGKELGLPAYALLGGMLHRRFLVDYTIGQDTPPAMAERALAMQDLGGYTGFCVKVAGHANNVDLDVARVRSVREAVGEVATIRVDANGGYDLISAKEFMRAIAPLHVEFVEQPIPAGDLEGLKRLASTTDIPISVDEGLQRLDDTLRLIDTGAVGILNVKIPKCGGLHLSRKIAAIAEAASIPVICGGGLAFEIIRQASRHFVAGVHLGNHDLHHEGPGPASQGLQADVTRRTVTYRDVKRWDGHVEVSDSPGLGVTADWDSITKHSSMP